MRYEYSDDIVRVLGLKMSFYDFSVIDEDVTQQVWYLNEEQGFIRAVRRKLGLRDLESMILFARMQHAKCIMER